MKRNPSPSGTNTLADELAELRGLDSSALKQRWRMLYRAAAPVRIGQALLLQAVAYRLQERVLGGRPEERPGQIAPGRGSDDLAPSFVKRWIVGAGSV